MSSSTKKMTYGQFCFFMTFVYSPHSCPARLGNSGLKVSKIILGTMQYGSPGWQEWVLEEDEAIKHIKAA